MLRRTRLDAPNVPNRAALRLPLPLALATLRPMTGEDEDNTRIIGDSWRSG